MRRTLDAALRRQIRAAAPAPAGKAEAASSSEPEPEPAESLEELLAAAGGSPGVLRCEILAG